MAAKRCLRGVVNAYFTAAKKEHDARFQEGRAAAKKNAATCSKNKAAQELVSYVRGHYSGTRYIPVGDGGLLIVSPDGTVREERLTKV